MVEFIEPHLEALLLARQVLGRRITRLPLQGQMHPFVPAVLFGMTGLDILHAYDE
ncbi:MAG: hypothetical protein V1742_01255 [Pseudomonadota bacterium]